MNNLQFTEWCCSFQNTVHSAFEKPLIMGILNVTPDSFSDGGLFYASEKACDHAMTMLAQGADIIDIGGESSQPWSQPISCEEEIDRIIPVIEKLRSMTDCCLSVDTHKPKVMHAAVQAGASMINDIQALSEESALSMARFLNVPICLMHMQGTPLTMQDAPYYEGDVLKHIHTFFEERMNTCEQEGIHRNKLIFDPGFGFGKTVTHNLQMMKGMETLRQYQRPLLLGVSRKSTIGAILKKTTDKRLVGGLALSIYAALKGVSILRTHDVDETKQAIDMIDAIHKVE